MPGQTPKQHKADSLIPLPNKLKNIVILTSFMKRKKLQEPPISVRISKENKIRLEEIMKRTNLHNRNKVLNQIIEDYANYEKHKELFMAVARLKEELKK